MMSVDLRSDTVTRPTAAMIEAMRKAPVGVVLDKQGALLVADDVGDAVWRVTAATH